MPRELYAAVFSQRTNFSEFLVPNAVQANLAQPDQDPTLNLGAIGNAITGAYATMTAAAGAAGHNNAFYVFLAPEYLLQGGHTGTRTVKETVKNTLESHLRGVSAQCQGMLIVPGTIPWRKKKGIERAYKKLAADAYNTALVLYDGQVVLRHDKHADVEELRDEDKTKPDGNGGHPRAQFVGGQHSGRFSVGTLRCGVEICGDHETGVLAGGGPADLDLHLLISANVSHRFDTDVGQAHVAVRDGGVFVHCDDSYGASFGASGAWQIARNPFAAAPATALPGASVTLTCYHATLN